MLAGLQGLDAQTLRLLAGCVLVLHASLAAWVVGGLFVARTNHMPFPEWEGLHSTQHGGGLDD